MEVDMMVEENTAVPEPRPDTPADDGGERKRRRERKKKSGWDAPPSADGTDGEPVVSLGAAAVLSVEQLLRLDKARQYAVTQMVKLPDSTVHVPGMAMPMLGQTAAQLQEIQQRSAQHRALQIMCRIYVGNISQEWAESNLEELFSPYGAIRSVSLSRDVTNPLQKHKGFAFVEFETPEAAMLAINHMTDPTLGINQNLKVGRPNNAPQAIAQNEEIVRKALEAPRIYIASVNTELEADQVREVFEAFGPIKKLQLAYDLGITKHKGYGYIEYEQVEAADDAVTHMNLFDLGGQLLRICRAQTPEIPEFLGTAHGNIEWAAKNIPPPNTGLLGSVPAHLAPDAKTVDKMEKKEPKDDLQAKVQKLVEDAAREALETKQKQMEEDDDDVGISGSSQRFLLMQKLQRKAGDRVVLLRNMVGPAEVDAELEGEVSEECAQFGKVERVVVYQEPGNDMDDEGGSVKIFVQFEDAEMAQRAQQALNGRWFGGRMVKAELYDGARFAANDLTG